jgi:glutamate synthase domain-containing protein 3
MAISFAQREKSVPVVKVDATGMVTRDLNRRLRELVASGVDKISIVNVCGQRYIGTDLNKPVEIEISGTPGNDLGSFMDGPMITVRGNAQDGCGNTMNSGEIVVHGHAGDVLGLAARGGTIFVRDGVGYRCGIHMKEYGEQKPVLVIGGTAQDPYRPRIEFERRRRPSSPLHRNWYARRRYLFAGWCKRLSAW